LLDEIVSLHPEAITFGFQRLLDLQQQAQVIMSKEFLVPLDLMRHLLWKHIATFGEARFYPSILLSFYFSTDHESIWLNRGDNAPEIERKIVRSLKMALTVV
jgi:hypothetical protein